MIVVSPRDIAEWVFDVVAGLAMELARILAETTGLFADKPKFMLILMIFLFVVWLRL